MEFNWIKFEDKSPERDQRILVYKSVDMGGYYKDIYIGNYVKEYNHSQYYIVIDDRETNKNNYRLIKEFSHWAPMPEIPKN